MHDARYIACVGVPLRREEAEFLRANSASRKCLSATARLIQGRKLETWSGRHQVQEGVRTRTAKPGQHDSNNVLLCRQRVGHDRLTFLRLGGMRRVSHRLTILVPEEVLQVCELKIMYITRLVLPKIERFMLCNSAYISRTEAINVLSPALLYSLTTTVGNQH